MKDIPIGLLMALAENEKTMRSFSALSQQQRDQLIAQASQASSREEMHQLVQNLQ